MKMDLKRWLRKRKRSFTVLSVLTILGLLITLSSIVIPKIMAGDTVVSDLVLQAEAEDESIALTVTDSNQEDTKIVVPLPEGVTYQSNSNPSIGVTQDTVNNQLVIDWVEGQEKQVTLQLEAKEEGSYDFTARTVREGNPVTSSPCSVAIQSQDTRSDSDEGTKESSLEASDSSTPPTLSNEDTGKKEISDPTQEIETSEEETKDSNTDKQGNDISSTENRSSKASGPIQLINGDFEDPVMFSTPSSSPGDKNKDWKYYTDDELKVNGKYTWRSAPVSGNRTPYVEFHGDNYHNANNSWGQDKKGPKSFNGKQHAELVAEDKTMLYQDVDTTPGVTVKWRVAHRGLWGTDTAEVWFGKPNSSNPEAGLVKIATMTSPNTEWKIYSGEYTIPAGQTVTRFGFKAISAGNATVTAGNLLDDIQFGTPSVLTLENAITTDHSVENNIINENENFDYSFTMNNSGGLKAVVKDVTVTLPDSVTYVPGTVIDGLTNITFENGVLKGELIEDEITPNVPQKITIPLKGVKDSGNQRISPIKTTMSYDDLGFETTPKKIDIENNDLIIQSDAAPVTVKYQDSKGNDLAPSEILNGKVGLPYNSKPKDIKNWKLKETPSNASGLFSNEEQTVIYIYTSAILRFYDVPSELSFNETKISSKTETISRQDPNWKIIVEDTRLSKRNWRVTAQLVDQFKDSSGQP
ncbi:MucBP domain-containing protein, partial [Lactococcus petauri]